MIQQPTQPTLTPTPTRAPQGGALKVAIVIVACLALAIPVIDALAASPAPTATLFAGAPGAPGAGGHPGKAPKGHPGKAPKGDKGLGPAGHGPGKGPITIRAISGSQLSLATEDGWTRTITAAPDTTITRGGVKIGVGDLRFGDEIRFRQTRNGDGTYTISAVKVTLPKVGGEVTGKTSNSITVKNRDGTTTVIHVTGSTTYKVKGKETGASLGDIADGDKVDAEGTLRADGSLDAVAVRGGPPKGQKPVKVPAASPAPG